MSNHCVPEWGPTERDLDFNIFDTDDYRCQTKSKIWDLGPAKKQDAAFVPDDFEELCWEDGQLLVVMQELGNRPGAKGINVHADEASSSLTSCDDINQSCITRPMMSSHEPPTSCSNLAHDDDLLSWLQLPQDDKFYPKSSETVCIKASSIVKEKGSACVHNYARGDGVSEATSLCSPFLLQRDTHHGRLSAAFLSISKQKCKNMQVDDYDLVASVSNYAHSSTLDVACDATHKSFRIQNATTEKNMESNALDLDDTTWTDASKAELFSTRNGFKEQTFEQGKTGMCSLHSEGNTQDESGCSCFEDMTRHRGMNFANFSRPAAAIKADLYSVGLANGMTDASRLKQLDRMGIHPFTSKLNKSTVDLDQSVTPAREDFSASRSAGASSTSQCEEDASLLQGTQEVYTPGFQNSVTAASVGASSTPQCEEDASLLQGTQEVYAPRFQNSVTAASTKLHTKTNSSFAKPTVTRSSEEDSSQSCQMKRLQKEDVYDCKAEAVKHSKPSDFEKTCNGLARLTTHSPMITGKRNRSAESHNLSERKRRNKIKEKMLALRELIPNVNKANDKASMLEEAITYLRSLQQKVQVMAFRGGKNSQWAGQFPLQMHCPDIKPLLRTPMGMDSAMPEMLAMAPKVATLPAIQGAPLPSASPLHGMIMPAIVGTPYPPPTVLTAPVAGVVHQGLAPPAYSMFLPVHPMIMPNTMNPF
ncbi:hypothetical protein L7F22_012303 [Adiantum nelumboides]|nr:hypothetical protein [Adiantum nelumboides]